MTNDDAKKSAEKDRLEKLHEVGSRPESEKRVKLKFLDYFKKNKDSISFGEKMETLYEYVTEGKLTGRDKAVVIGALLYFINPLDVIPDLTPFLGFSDDVGLIYLVYNYLQNRSIEKKKRD